MGDAKRIRGLRPNLPVAAAARLALAARLDYVGRQLELALRRPARGGEHVHQLRVGSRRAVAALKVFAVCLPGKMLRRACRKLRRLRRSAGKARDWDVFLEGLATGQGAAAGSDFVAGYAFAQRAAAGEELAAAADRFAKKLPRLTKDVMKAVTEPAAEEWGSTLLDLARPVLAEHLGRLREAAAGDLGDPARLHQVRIAGKRLRYAMELFADCFAPVFRERLLPAVVDMQEILGRANDSRVARRYLLGLRATLRDTSPAAWRRERPAINALLRHHERRSQQERRRFLQWWRRWQAAGTEKEFAALVENGHF